MIRTVAIAPYGYRLDGANLVPDAREQAALAIVRDGRAREVSIAKLAEELRERGFTTRTGRPFGPSAVYAIMKALEESRAA